MAGKSKIILRADGNSVIGMGHVYRMLALADLLKNDFEISFAISNPDALLKKIIQQNVQQIIELPDTFQYKLLPLKSPKEEMPFDLAAHLSGNEIVVLDGYYFGEAYQHMVKSSGCKLVYIDDLQDQHMYADVIINNTPGISSEEYRKEPYSQVFIGANYALLRREFYDAAITSLENHDKKIPENVTICFGGADPYGLNIKFSEYIVNASFAVKNLHVLVPVNYDQKERLHKLKALTTRIDIHLHSNLNASDICSLFKQTDLGIVSASMIAFEAISCGIVLLCGWYNQNQFSFYNYMKNNNLIQGLGNLVDCQQESFEESYTNSKISYTQIDKFRNAISVAPENIRNIFLKIKNRY